MDELYWKRMLVLAVVTIVLLITVGIPMWHWVVYATLTTWWMIREDSRMVTTWSAGLIGLHL